VTVLEGYCALPRTSRQTYGRGGTLRLLTAELRADEVLALQDWERAPEYVERPRLGARWREWVR